MMTMRRQSLEERIQEAQKLLDKGICEDAAEILTTALVFRPLSVEREAQIRAMLSEAYDILGFPQKAHEAIGKYEAPTIHSSVPVRIQIRLLVRLGRAWDKLHDQPRAIAYLNSALKLAEQAADKEGIGQVYLAMGRTYRVMSESTIATDCLDRALEQFRLVGNRRALAQTYLELGLVDMHEGEYDSAVGHFANSEMIIKDGPDYFVLGSVYLNSAVVESWQKYSGKASQQLERAYDYFTHAKHQKMIAHVSTNLGMCLINSGDWVRAEEVLSRGVEISRRFSETRLTANTLDNVALLMVLEGRTKEAKAFLDEGLDLLRDLNAKWVEVQLRFTYTQLHLVCGDIARASESASNCLEMSQGIKDTQFVIRSRLFLAEIALAKREYSEVRTELRRIETALEENPNLPSLGLCRRLEGKLALSSGAYEEAKQLFLQSLSIFETREDVYQVAITNLELGRFFFALGDAEQAGRRYELALGTLKPLGARPAINTVERELEHIDTSSTGTIARAGVAEILTGPLLKRVVAASSGLDLLVAETLNIVWEATRVDGVLLCRERKTTREMEVLGTRGRAGERTQQIVERLTGGDKQFLSGLTWVLCSQQPECFYVVLDSDSPISDEVRAQLEPVLQVIEQGIELTQLRARPRSSRPTVAPVAQKEVSVPGFVHSSAAMNRILEQIHKIRSSDVTVLITGESGTGKELIAKAVHAESARRQYRFVPFNCTATSKELMDSQLFGYKKGAFTGAIADSPGTIRAAEHGTLFLDEIGDLAIDVQPKLLRFLQEGEIQPLGEKEPVKVDVRILAATNSDLEKKVAEGVFREDLFHRLNVIRLHIPPLRERREEIPLFVGHFLSMFCAQMKKNAIVLAQEAVDLMVLYDWPGNVRQLSNEIQRIVAMSESHSAIGPEALSKEILTPTSAGMARIRELHFGATPNGIVVDSKQPLSHAVSHLEREMLRDVLHRNQGNITKTARELGLTRRGLRIKKQRLGVE